MTNVANTTNQTVRQNSHNGFTKSIGRSAGNEQKYRVTNQNNNRKCAFDPIMKNINEYRRTKQLKLMCL